MPEILTIEIVEKLVANKHDKTEYVIHVWDLKQALDQGLKKVNRLSKFNQNAWLKPCIEMNTDLRKKAKKKSLKHFNNSKAFIEYSNNMDGIYKNVEEYNPNKKRKILIVFDDMIVVMLIYKSGNWIIY